MIKALVKKELAEIYSGLFRDPKTGKKRVGGALIGYAILYIYVVGIFIMSFGTLAYSICSPLGEQGLSWLYFAIGGVLSLLLGIIGSVTVAQAHLYNANDNDSLLALPIKPSAILIARMASIFIWDWMFSAFALIPFGVVYALVNAVTALYWVLYLIVLFALPLFGFAITCVLAFFMAFMASKVKKKNIMTLVFLVVFLIAYFYFYSQIQTYIQLVIERAGEIAVTFQKALYPLYCMGKGLCGDIVSYIIFIGIIGAFVAFIFFILSKTYFRILSTNRGTATVKYKEKRLKESKPVKALFFKELKLFTGSTVYLTNCGMGTLMMIGLTVFAIIKKASVTSIDGVTAEQVMEYAPLVGVAFTLFTGAIAPVTAPSISLEGKSLWIVKTLPVDYRDVLKAKLLLQVAVVSAPAFVCVAVFGIVMGSGIIETLICAITATVLCTVFGEIGLLVNLKKPVFNWTNETAVVKQGANIGITLLLNFVSFMAVIGLGAVIAVALGGMAASLILLVASAVLMWLLYRSIMTKGVRLFDEF